MKKHQIEAAFQGRGTNLGKLLGWLQQPRQGIVPQVAVLGIREVAEELLEGKEWYRESLMYPETYRKRMEEGVFPESFWLDNYVLERCRMIQEELIEGVGLDPAEDPFKFNERIEGIESGLVQLNEAIEKRVTKLNQKLAHATMLLLRIDAMVTPIKRFLSIPPWMKWTGRKLKKAAKWTWEVISFGRFRHRKRGVPRNWRRT